MLDHITNQRIGIHPLLELADNVVAGCGGLHTAQIWWSGSKYLCRDQLFQLD